MWSNRGDPRSDLAGGRKLSFVVLRQPLWRYGVFGDAKVWARLEFAGKFGAGFVKCAACFVGDRWLATAPSDVFDQRMPDAACVDGGAAAFGCRHIVTGGVGAFEILRRQSDHRAAVGAGREQDGCYQGR